MRTSFVITLLCVVALAAGLVGVRLGRGTVATPSNASDVHLLPETQKAPRPAVAVAPEQVVTPSPVSEESLDVSADESASMDALPEPEPPAPLEPTPFTRAVDTMVSSVTSFREKQAALDELQAMGALDQAIESLAQGAVENPASPSYPAALGQAQLRKAGELAQAGGKINEMGMLGMQADQNFDTALELDPSHWEAQFFKAASMSYWPLELNKGEEVLERFARLIDQQDTMRAQPEFAQTYVLLGDQYMKMSQPDYAVATWELGVRKFPGDPALRQKLSGF